MVQINIPIPAPSENLISVHLSSLEKQFSASSYAFLLESVFKKSFLLGASKV